MYGIPYDDSNNWSILFNHILFDQFMFMSNDLVDWAIVSKDEILGTYYDNVSRNILRKSTFPNSPSTSTGNNNRSSFGQDPVIRITDKSTDTINCANSDANPNNLPIL